MKIIIALQALFMLPAVCCKAQNAQNYANNVAMQTKDLADVKGSAYSTTEWAKATVIMDNKTAYTNMDAKYNEYEDKLVTKGQNEEVMEFNNKVKSFTLSYTQNGAGVLALYSNGFNVEGHSSNAYFEILADGKTQLLKKVTKKIQTQTEYGATSSTRSFVTTTRYFVVSGDKSFVVKKDSKSVLAALGDKSAQVESYAKAQKLDFKKEEDLVKILAYCNKGN